MADVLKVKDGIVFQVTYDDGVVASVPKIDGNIEYEKIKQYIIDGGIIEPEFTDDELLDKAKYDKLLQVMSDYETSDTVPVLYNGTYYNGGEESATSIDKYVRLNRIAGAISHTIWDIDNVDTVLTDAQADELLLAIGYTSSVNKFTLKDRKRELNDITLDALMPDGVTLKYPTLSDAIAAAELV